MIDNKNIIDIISKQVISILKDKNKNNNFKITELGEAKIGNHLGEVVIGIAPGFSINRHTTICDIKHSDVLREISAGIEEEGMKTRFIRVYETSDVCFIAKKAAVYSGSGIGIGIQSKGTIVIHQKDLFPLSNLELFPQAPVLNLKIYRQIGKNAARYAKGQNPIPIETINDPMSRPKYQSKAAVLHAYETKKVEAKKPTELEIILW